MAYNWEKEADREGGEQSERLPSGIHDVEITRVVFGSKQGGVFTSKSGDPQIMLIFADSEGREASLMVTLSRKAGWVLAKVLRAAGLRMSQMTADGVEPKDFASEQFATANLVGRRLRIDVKWFKSERDGKEYADVMPVATGANYSQPAETTSADDIPI